jgi:tetratricopeptide (TPR) repeat protein
MAAEQKKPAGAAPPQPLRRRYLLAALLLAAAAAGLAGWWHWRGGPVPPPPEAPAQESDPAVAQAIQAMRSRVQQEPRSGQAWGRLGQVLYAHEWYEEGQACFVQAERFDPRNPRWSYYQGCVRISTDLDAGLALLRKAADRCTDEDPENTTPRLALAEGLLQAGRTDQAEAEFRHVLKQQPSNPRAHYGLGLVAAAEGNLKAARACLERCADSPQTRQKVAAQLAKILPQLRDRAGAAAADQRARELPADRNWPDPYADELVALVVSRQGRLHRAQLLRAQKRFAEAIDWLRPLLEQPGDWPAYLELGQNLAGLKDYAGATEALRAAARAAPQEFAPCHLLSRVLIEQARLAADKPEQRLQALYQFREAADYARRAAALRPEDAAAQVYLGLALRGAGQRAEAGEAWRAAVRRWPDQADAYLYLAEALAEDGRPAEARSLLEQACRQVRPDDLRPRQALERLGKAATH